MKLTLKALPITLLRDVLKTNWNGSRRLAFICAMLVWFAAAPLHAQFFQDLYDFNCNTGGCKPVDYGQLTQGSDGNLYGTTYAFDSNGGTIFKVTPSGTYTDLVSFDSTTGVNPSAALTLASDGNFYGTTFGGGSSGDGTLFRFTPPSNLVVLHNFSGSDGVNPTAPPIQAKDGNLYGVAGQTAYRVSLPGGKFRVLTGSAPGEAEYPLYLASDGNMYGVSTGGLGYGTVFSMTTTGEIHPIYEFTGGADGLSPLGLLTEGSDGNLWGTTAVGGGASGAGTIFKVTLCSQPLCATEKPVHAFDLATDGGSPAGSLRLSSSGAFYGTTSEGGANGYGTLFEITYGGVFSKLVDFTGETGAAPGYDPATTLVQHTNGSFYGLTIFGGSNGEGNFYGYTPVNPLISLIVEGPVWLAPGVTVEIFGDHLNEVIGLTFAGVQAQFQPGSDTYLVAQVPMAAVDGLITATLETGQQVESQGAMHILPVITNLDPSSGPVGTQVGIVGGGFAGATKVTFGGVKAINFAVDSPTLIVATVPTGAKTGKVKVATRNGIATSKQTFTIN
jgi:uncharacterized repeat protein (TIGR03803 family)